MIKLGLIGKNIDYSFSRKYFTEKFENESIDGLYSNYDCATPEEVKNLLDTNEDCHGFNVTIPYKEVLLELLIPSSV